MRAEAESRSVLLCSSEGAWVAASGEALRAAGYEVAEVQGPAAATRALEAQRTDLVLVQLDLSSPDGPAALELADALAQRGAQPIVCARVRASGDWAPLFRRAGLRHLFGLSDSLKSDALELTATADKLLTGELFGVDRYLVEGGAREEVEVTRSLQRDEVVARADAFAQAAGCSARVAQSVGVAVDELFTNALYNAPVDAEGRPRQAHISRTVPVELGPGERVVVTFATDGRRLCVSALDPFGSLRPERVHASLSRCVAGGPDQIEFKAGGAGLGLYYLFNLVSGFVLNVDPGRATESIGLFDVTRSFREHAARPRSFNLFVAPPRP